MLFIYLFLAATIFFFFLLPNVEVWVRVPKKKKNSKHAYSKPRTVFFFFFSLFSPALRSDGVIGNGSLVLM